MEGAEGKGQNVMSWKEQEGWGCMERESLRARSRGRGAGGSGRERRRAIRSLKEGDSVRERTGGRVLVQEGLIL